MLAGNRFFPQAPRYRFPQSAGDPVPFSPSQRVDRSVRSKMLDFVAKVNAQDVKVSGDPEIQTSIAQQEMACMQTSIPEPTDLSSESDLFWNYMGPEISQAPLPEIVSWREGWRNGMFALFSSFIVAGTTIRTPEPLARSGKRCRPAHRCFINRPEAARTLKEDDKCFWANLAEPHTLKISIPGSGRIWSRSSPTMLHHMDGRWRNQGVASARGNRRVLL